MDSLKALFVAELAARNGEFEFAAELFYRSFTRDAVTTDGCIYQDLDWYCEDLGHNSLREVLSLPKTDALHVLAQVLRSRYSGEILPTPSIEGGESKLDTLRIDPVEAASYLYTKMKHSFNKHVERVQIALFWANAEWAHRYGHTLVLEPAVRNRDYFAYQSTLEPLGEWVDGTCEQPNTPSMAANAEVQEVLTTCVAHVAAGSWETIKEEYHTEPVWINTFDGEPIVEQRMTAVYGGQRRRTLLHLFTTSTT